MIRKYAGRIKRSVLYALKYRKTEYQLYRLRKGRKLHILNARATVEYILENRVSVARFGDGEFNLVFNKQGINFQQGNLELSKRLAEVLASRNPELLVCIPYAINSVRGLNGHARVFYNSWALGNYERLADFMSEHGKTAYLFGDTNMTRPYKDWDNELHPKELFPLVKKLWEGRPLLIVEGSKTRLGVGNDLFQGVESIKRILAPAENAFDRYSEIKEKVLAHYAGELVILALGPTATVLAYDLSQLGIQTLDVGHIDIEYEWYLRGATHKIAIPGKYTNEAGNGNQVEDCKDAQYMSEIVAQVGMM